MSTNIVHLRWFQCNVAPHTYNYDFFLFCERAKTIRADEILNNNMNKSESHLINTVFNLIKNRKPKKKDSRAILTRCVLVFNFVTQNNANCDGNR
jgi:hypothetical protein